MLKKLPLVMLIVLLGIAPSFASTTVSVPANASGNGYNSGITVNAGDTIQYSATGMWTLSGCNTASNNDADGYVLLGNSSYRMEGGRQRSLVGRIGTSGSWFQMGTTGDLIAPASGTLYMGANDANTGFGDNCGSISVTITIIPLPQYYNPLLPDDEVSMVTDGVTVATATRGFLPVHAPANATVTSITPLDGDDCSGLGVSLVTCATIALGGTYKVVLSVDGESYTYIIGDAPTYMSEGDGISAGCIMGESTQTIGVVVSTIPLAYFTLTPSTSAEPCKDAPPPPENCLNDSLTNESAWYRQGAVTWGNEVVLGTGGRIYQIITIPSNVRARLVITAKGGTALLTIGNTAQSFTLPDEFGSVSIPYAIHTPNLADFYEVSVKNTGDENLTLSAICLDLENNGQADDDGDLNGDGIPEPQTNCYFANYSFSDGLNDWSLSGNVQDGTGMALIPDGEGVAQYAYLPPNEYTIYLDVGLWYDDTFDLQANATEPIVISYMFPLAETPDYVDFGNYTLEDIGDNFHYRIAVNFTIATDTEGDFYFEIDTPTVTGLDGGSIARACLVPSNGDWGDNPPPDDGLPFTEYCEVMTPPRGNDVGQWTAWHWHNLNQFFQCELMINLNNTYGLLRWFQAMFMLFMNWLGDMGTWINGHVQNLIFAITHSDQLKEWQMPDNIPSGGVWSSGGFALPSNLDSPQDFESESCQWYDVFCHGRNIVGGVVDFAGGVINDVASVLINFIGALLAQIVDLITWGYRQFVEPITQLWNDFWELIGNVKDTIALIFEGENNFITMWNDTEPLPPPGLQDCSAQPEIKTLCLIYWVAENTLLEGTWGSLIIPLLTSILGIFGLLLVLKNFIALVETARNA